MFIVDEELRKEKNHRARGLPPGAWKIDKVLLIYVTQTNALLLADTREYSTV